MYGFEPFHKSSLVMYVSLYIYVLGALFLLPGSLPLSEVLLVALSS